MNILIVGQGAIGRAVARLAMSLEHQVTVFTRDKKQAAEGARAISLPDWEWSTVSTASADLPSLPDRLIITTGMLWTEHQQPEKRLEDLAPDQLLASMSANALVPMAVLSAFSRRLNRRDAMHALVVTAKVGSIDDNRLGGWYSYRASKAACNMLLRTTAIEWQRRFPACAIGAYHPGTTDSALSDPFQARVPDYQLKSPDQAAECLWKVLENHIIPPQTGRFWSWDGSELPW